MRDPQMLSIGLRTLPALQTSAPRHDEPYRLP